MQLIFLTLLAGGLILFFILVIKKGWKYKKEADNLLPRRSRTLQKAEDSAEAEIEQKIIRLDKCEEGEKLRKVAKKEKRYGRLSFLWGQHKKICIICRHKYGRNNK